MSILNKTSQPKKIERQHPPIEQTKISSLPAEQRDYFSAEKKEANSVENNLTPAEPNFTEKQPSQAGQNVAAAVSQNKSSLDVKKIEAILEDNLGDLYLSLDEGHRRIFKEEGERTARQIEQVIRHGKSVVVKVIELIKHWLKFIPGVNKFFIEQEAKIKAERILHDLTPPTDKI